jgi:tetratricopeptide (TPR) repeat protein
MYREALDIADALGNTGFRAWIQTHLCWTLADLSRWDEASDALDAALAEHRRTEDLVAQERDLQFRGKLHLDRANAVNSTEYYQKAAESYREAADIADRRGDSFAADEWTRAANLAEGQAAATEGAID